MHNPCRCGAIGDMPNPAPHVLHGLDPAVIRFQVADDPNHGREAHTARECYREVPAGFSWSGAIDRWRASLGAERSGQGRAIPAPMPVGHVMFGALAGSASLSRRDNRVREAGL